MKIIKIGEPEVIMSNSQSIHNYFGWPTAVRLQNGKIGVAASGFRLSHVCPFGKAVISYSENDGKTYTSPAPVIDTPLDDRDGGIMTFGKSGVIVTSFNNTVEFQRKFCETHPAYRNAYLDTVSPEDEEAALGSTFKISNDCGVTFGKMYKSPVTSPHGPIELKDGRILWVGAAFRSEEKVIKAYTLDPKDGSMEYVGQIENVTVNGVQPSFEEPHVTELDDGTLICHIRADGDNSMRIFTIFQSESKDGGKTWTTPHMVLDIVGGAPAHLFKHSSGMLISTYGYRNPPYGVRAMFSADGAKTWDSGYELFSKGVSPDLGYPSTVEMSDGSMITVFYAKLSEDEPAVIMQQRWRFEK